MKNASISALRQERERRGWSRNYIAEKVEVDVITVGRWERGERMPHPHHRQKLCALFDMNAQDLGLVSTLPQDPDKAATVTDPSPEEAPAPITDVPDLSPEAPVPLADVPDLSPETPVSIADMPDLSPQTSLTDTPVSALPFYQRRKVLLAGLGGLGTIALVGSGLLLTSHSSPVSVSVPTPISMPLSKRIRHFVDPNTSNWVNHLAWSPDRNQIAVAVGANVVSIWNIEQSAVVLYYPTPNGWVNDISWSKANLIAATTADFQGGSLQLWKFPAEKPIFTLQRPYGLRSVSWSPDGKYLVLSSRTATVEVWDPLASRVVSQYSAPTTSLMGITRAKWSASGTFLACVADDGTAHVWEALTGRPRTIYRGHKSRVIDLAWSPDEQHIVSASADKTAHVWDASSGRSIFTYQGHTGEVEGVDWFPNGTYIASGSADRTVHVWEALTGKLVAKYEGHTSIVECVLWSADGTTLAIGTEKEGIEIWQSPFV